MSLYRKLSGINSQINEQRNAGLKKLRNQVSYMTEEKFAKHVRLHLWYNNLALSED